MDDEIWMTTQEAAAHAGVSTWAIYQWCNRGHLRAAGLNEKGQKLFRHLDVARAEKATRAKAKRVLAPAA
ncbi:helix-turn-helix domain-containing protein [Streptomyces sp. NPDC052207]|uniref:helix-turn-helix domain-containing protein n=1 Tax=Streptomyces sp. NPDC052207 TaxID=3155418 RepID=UPI0034252EAD